MPDVQYRVAVLCVEYCVIVGCFLQIWKARIHTVLAKILECGWYHAGRTISLLLYTSRESRRITYRVESFCKFEYLCQIKQQSSKSRQTVSSTLIAERVDGIFFEEGRDVTCRMFYPYSGFMASAKCGSFSLLQL
jgi:hypothetical protein